PRSEMRLRFLTPSTDAIDQAWWAARIHDADERRASLRQNGTAYRVVYGEGDGLPALIVDRYGDVVVAQLLSAGLESVRDDVVAAIRSVLDPRAILLRNDAAVRRHEGLALETVDVWGTTPDTVEVVE